MELLLYVLWPFSLPCPIASCFWSLPWPWPLLQTFRNGINHIWETFDSSYCFEKYLLSYPLLVSFVQGYLSGLILVFLLAPSHFALRAPGVLPVWNTWQVGTLGPVEWNSLRVSPHSVLDVGRLSQCLFHSWIMPWRWRCYWFIFPFTERDAVDAAHCTLRM